MLPDDNHDADGAQDDAVVDHGVGTPDRLQRLWAPYRMSYIAKGVQDSHSATVGRDPFIEVPKMSDEDGLIIARGEYVFCVLNLYPYDGCAIPQGGKSGGFDTGGIKRADGILADCHSGAENGISS